MESFWKVPAGPVGEAWTDGVGSLLGRCGPRCGWITGMVGNVVLHEFAHQLDQEDGVADGVPILERREFVRRLRAALLVPNMNSFARTSPTAKDGARHLRARPIRPNSSPWPPSASSEPGRFAGSIPHLYEELTGILRAGSRATSRWRQAILNLNSNASPRPKPADNAIAPDRSAGRARSSLEVNIWTRLRPWRSGFF